MKTLEQTRLDPAVLKIPRPSFYPGSDTEWEAGCRRVVEDLTVLSHRGAAWATMVIEGLLKDRDGGAT